MELKTAANASFVGFDGGIQQLTGEDTAVILPVLLGSICAIGIAGNILVLVVLTHSIKVKKRASGMVVLLANVSGTDFLILAVCGSARAVTYHERTWTLGHLACRTAEWFQHGCLAAKSLTLAVLSRARYHFDFHPSNDSHLKLKRILLTAGSMWALGLVISVVDIVFSKLQVKGNVSLCVTELPRHSSDFMRAYSKILALVVFAFPAVCHVPSSKCKFRVATRTENRLALLGVTAANALLLMPEWTAWLWQRHGPHESCTPPAALLVLAQVCTYLASASSPAILLTMLVPLRERLAWLMCRRASRGRKTERNVSEARAMVVGSLDDDAVRRTDALGRTLPDVEHFWTGRRNTAVPDNTHPLPWEGLEHGNAEL